MKLSQILLGLLLTLVFATIGYVGVSYGQHVDENRLSLFIDQPEIWKPVSDFQLVQLDDHSYSFHRIPVDRQLEEPFPLSYQNDQSARDIDHRIHPVLQRRLRQPLQALPVSKPRLQTHWPREAVSFLEVSTMTDTGKRTYLIDLEEGRFIDDWPELSLGDEIRFRLQRSRVITTDGSSLHWEQAILAGAFDADALRGIVTAIVLPPQME